MVQTLLETEGVKVLILGGAHDLSDNVRRIGSKDVELIVVEVQAYEQEAAQSS